MLPGGLCYFQEFPAPSRGSLPFQGVPASSRVSLLLPGVIDTSREPLLPKGGLYRSESVPAAPWGPLLLLKGP